MSPPLQGYFQGCGGGGVFKFGPVNVVLAGILDKGKRGPLRFRALQATRVMIQILSGSFSHPQPLSLPILLSEPGSERKVLTKET